MNTLTSSAFVLQILAGAAASAALAKVMPYLSLGWARNVLVGAIGGAVGGRWLHPSEMESVAPTLDISAVTGGIGGAVLMLVVGVLWWLKRHIRK